MLDAATMVGRGAQEQSYATDSGEASRPALGGETQEAVDDTSSAQSSPGRPEDSAQNSLTNETQESEAPGALSQGTEAPQSAPADSSLTSASVGMPSAEMLAAANENGVEGAAKSNGEVGRVLADALAGGGNGPDINAVLDAMANGPGAAEALATRHAGSVPGWDMVAFAVFPGGPAMDHMALHHDAVPPAG
jgi:hypothetical protein